MNFNLSGHFHNLKLDDLINQLDLTSLRWSRSDGCGSVLRPYDTQAPPGPPPAAAILDLLEALFNLNIARCGNRNIEPLMPGKNGPRGPGRSLLSPSLATLAVFCTSSDFHAIKLGASLNLRGILALPDGPYQ